MKRAVQEIDATMRYNGNLAYQQEMLKRLDAVEARQQQQREQEAVMDAEVADLKKQLDALTRRRSVSGN